MRSFPTTNHQPLPSPTPAFPPPFISYTISHQTATTQAKSLVLEKKKTTCQLKCSVVLNEAPRSGPSPGQSLQEANRLPAMFDCAQALREPAFPCQFASTAQLRPMIQRLGPYKSGVRVGGYHPVHPLDLSPLPARGGVAPATTILPGDRPDALWRPA